MTKTGGGSLKKATKLKIKKEGELFRKSKALNESIRQLGIKTQKRKAQRNKVLSNWSKLTQRERNAIISGKKKTKLQIKAKPKTDGIHELVLEVNRQMIQMMNEHDKKKSSVDLIDYIKSEFVKKKNPISGLIKFIKAERKKNTSSLTKAQLKDIRIVLKNLKNVIDPKGGSGQIEPLFNAIMMPDVPSELPLVLPSVPTTPLPSVKKTSSKKKVKAELTV